MEETKCILCQQFKSIDKNDSRSNFYNKNLSIFDNIFNSLQIRPLVSGNNDDDEQIHFNCVECKILLTQIEKTFKKYKILENKLTKLKEVVNSYKNNQRQSTQEYHSSLAKTDDRPQQFENEYNNINILDDFGLDTLSEKNNELIIDELEHDGDIVTNIEDNNYKDNSTFDQDESLISDNILDFNINNQSLPLEPLFESREHQENFKRSNDNEKIIPQIMPKIPAVTNSRTRTECANKINTYCSVCNKTFRDNWKLKRHFETIKHIQNSELAPKILIENENINDDSLQEEKENETFENNNNIFNSSNEINVENNEIKEEMTSFPPEKYCFVCQKMFRDNWKLRRHFNSSLHILNVGGDPNNVKQTSLESKIMSSFKKYCFICERGFYTEETYEKHCQSMEHIFYTSEREKWASLKGISIQDFQEETKSNLSESTNFSESDSDDNDNDICDISDLSNKKKSSLKCDQCCKVFKSIIQLNYHKEMNFCKNQEFKKICTFCNQNFEDRRKFRRHLRCHKIVKCDICNKMVRARGLNDHLMLLHNHSHQHQVQSETISSPSRSLKCTIENCNHVFSSRRRKLQHLCKVHQIAKYKCVEVECGMKLFVTKLTYDTHIAQNHTGDKRFICEICGVGFASNNYLDKHKRRTHRESKNCFVCGNLVKDLREHMNSVHSDTTYQCDVCGFVTKSKVYFKSHCKVMHSPLQEKMRYCKICDKQIGKFASMKIHMRDHHSVKKDGLTTTTSTTKKNKRKKLEFNNSNFTDNSTEMVEIVHSTDILEPNQFIIINQIN